jgi:hypothetical protein
LQGPRNLERRDNRSRQEIVRHFNALRLDEEGIQHHRERGQRRES